MEAKKPSSESKQQPAPELDLPSCTAGPKPHPPRFIDPRIVAAHFAPLLKNMPSAEERWAKKANATPFLG